MSRRRGTRIKRMKDGARKNAPIAMKNKQPAYRQLTKRDGIVKSLFNSCYYDMSGVEWRYHT